MPTRNELAILDETEALLASAAQEGHVVKVAKPSFGYYRLPNGDIGVADSSPSERMYYFDEGWQFLPQYGTFDNTTEYTANHPFECFFMRGGAPEMSVRQVKEHGFHVRPPIIPRCRVPIGPSHKKHGPTCFPGIQVKFPQVEAEEELYCSEEGCYRSQPGEGFSTEAGKRQHEQIMHKEAAADVRTGTALANAIVAGLAPILQAMVTNQNPQTIPASLPPEQANVLKILTDAGLTQKQKKELGEKLGIIFDEDKNG